MTALRRMALQGTELAKATAGTIRLKLLKLGALVTVSVRRIKIAIASACPLKDVFVNAHRRLCLRRRMKRRLTARALTKSTSPNSKTPGSQSRREIMPTIMARVPHTTQIEWRPPNITLVRNAG